MEVDHTGRRCVMLIVKARLTGADNPLTECYHPGKRILIVLHLCDMQPEMAVLVL